MTEAELIETILEQLHQFEGDSHIQVGPGDDAAVVDLPLGEQLVVSTDTLIPEVHFKRSMSAETIGYRAMAVSASDLAAMGASPLMVTVGLTLEGVDAEWIQGFVRGLNLASEELGLVVAGGNLARGDLNLAMTVHGSVKKGNALVRGAGEVGDDIWVTGTLGATTAFHQESVNSSLVVEQLLELRDHDPIARYFCPHARIQLGQQLLGTANACIDVSDGLSNELLHLCKSGSHGVNVDLAKVPIWRDLSVEDVIGADDSYELLFSAPKVKRNEVLDIAKTNSTPVVVIGEIVSGSQVRLTLEGEEVTPPLGFDHFS